MLTRSFTGTWRARMVIGLVVLLLLWLAQYVVCRDSEAPRGLYETCPDGEPNCVMPSGNGPAGDTKMPVPDAGTPEAGIGCPHPLGCDGLGRPKK